MNNQYGMSSLVFSILMFANFSLYADSHSIKTCHMLENTKKTPHSSQMVVVQSAGGFRGIMTLCQRQGNKWSPMFQTPFKVVLGKNGIASIGNKKEGDLKTPAGVYPIGEAFGMYPLALKMDFKYITKEDKFIDDANHKLYNTWVNGSTDAKSYESMLIKPYAYGAIVNYNMNPIKAAKGSAIFIHLWSSSDSPTSGCIALEKRDLLTMLNWLDKNQHPCILINESDEPLP
jgi:L,D-peptidoglycan transpeptidase YkuD (ErfK/YbiS/YcfS/YnhG family)